MIYFERTGEERYWKPIRPWISVGRLDDPIFAEPLYQYYSQTDTGTVAKPLSLRFESRTGSAGSFELEIEDSDHTLDVDAFSRGCRVSVIAEKGEIEPMGVWYGVVRSLQEKQYGINGHNVILKGYSILIRNSERIIDFEAISSGRSASGMFTMNLIDMLLSDDNVYLFTQNDSDMWNIIRNEHVSSSNIIRPVPRASAHMSTLSESMNQILEYSDSLIGPEMELRQNVLYNADDAQLSFFQDSVIYTLTNRIDLTSDPADTTMYPLSSYTYSYGYDYPVNASRLVASIGSSSCNPGSGPSGGGDPSWLEGEWQWALELADDSENTTNAIAIPFVASSASVLDMKLGLTSIGNASFMNYAYVAFLTNAVISGVSVPDRFLGTGTGWYPSYRHGVPGTAFPSIDTTNFWLGFSSGQNVGTEITLTPGVKYWVALKASGTVYLANSIAWIGDNQSASYGYSNDHLVTVSVLTGDSSGATHAFRIDYQQGSVIGGRDCAGMPGTEDAMPNFIMGTEMNATNRTGLIEKTLTTLPGSAKDINTLNEYMFDKLYVASKPKFTFTYPALTMPTIPPKAGDILCHFDTKFNVGTKKSAVQTSMITEVVYDFRQDETGALGLTKIALTTSGLKRGSY